MKSQIASKEKELTAEKKLVFQLKKQNEQLELAEGEMMRSLNEKTEENVIIKKELDISTKKMDELTKQTSEKKGLNARAT